MMELAAFVYGFFVVFAFAGLVLADVLPRGSISMGKFGKWI